MPDPRLVVHLLTDRSKFTPGMRGAGRDLATFRRAQSDAGQGVRQFNTAIIQASFGVQDFAQVLMQPGMGLAGALRASTNNLSQVLMMFGGIKGALIGTAATLGGVWLASWLDSRKAMDANSESAERFKTHLDEINQSAKAMANRLRVSLSIQGLDSSDAIRGRMQDTTIEQRVSEKEVEDLVASARRLRRELFEEMVNPFTGEATGFRRDEQGNMIRREGVTDEQVAGLQRIEADIARIDQERLDRKRELLMLEERLVQVQKAELAKEENDRMHQEAERRFREMQRAQEEADRQRERAAEDQKRQAESFFEATRTPQERFEAEAARIEELFRAGAFAEFGGRETADRALEQARERLRGDDEERPGRFDRRPIGGVAAVDARSTEAFSIIQAAIRGGMTGDSSKKIEKYTQQSAVALARIETNTRNLPNLEESELA